MSKVKAIPLIGLFAVGCGGAEVDVRLVGTWLPTQDGRGLVIKADGIGTIISKRELLGRHQGLPIQWRSHAESLRIALVGEEGEIGEWRTLGFRLKNDQLRFASEQATDLGIEPVLFRFPQ